MRIRCLFAVLAGACLVTPLALAEDAGNAAATAQGGEAAKDAPAQTGQNALYDGRQKSPENPPPQGATTDEKHKNAMGQAQSNPLYNEKVKTKTYEKKQDSDIVSREAAPPESELPAAGPDDAAIQHLHKENIVHRDLAARSAATPDAAPEGVNPLYESKGDDKLREAQPGTADQGAAPQTSNAAVWPHMHQTATHKREAADKPGNGKADADPSSADQARDAAAQDAARAAQQPMMMPPPMPPPIMKGGMP